jgi:hypothetical protein
MQSSLNEDGKSVAISNAKISIALASSLFLRTNSSLAKMAQAAPSEVGLHCSFVNGS